MDDIKIATAQFENKSGDQAYNLSVIGRMAAKASTDGACLIAFHECSILGYSHVRNCSKEELDEIAEFVPQGKSIKKLQSIASKNNIAVCAGVLEKGNSGKIYDTYVCVDGTGVIGKYRKLNPCINPHVSSGSQYCVFDLFGWKFGILICCDNNIIENVRATRLLGAQVLLMPHTALCTPLSRSVDGFVDSQLCFDGEKRSEKMHRDLNRPKGREWLMKWLPSRAYDNAMYCIFSNNFRTDDDELKIGCSMILDPFGDIAGECINKGDGLVSVILNTEKLTNACGERFLAARRPGIYRHIIGNEPIRQQILAWISDNKN